MSDKENVIAPGSRVIMHYRLAMEDGNVVDSADLLAMGPLVVTLFRGHW